MKKRTWRYKRVLGVSFALALFLGGIGVVQKVLDDQTEQFEEESVVKIEENNGTTNSSDKTVETLKAPV